MKRLHVHVSVDDLDRSVSFDSTLFAIQPSVVRTDYAKWMLEDPRVNFAISARSRGPAGLDHLGIQGEEDAELQDVYARLKSADAPVLEQGAVTCCYHASEKSWITDPAGINWEAFLTQGETTVYGDGGLSTAHASACCGEPPAPSDQPCCDPAEKPCCAQAA